MKNRREQILQKALELYLERGYAGVSISVLQNELNIGRATMYYYFKDKDSLFRTVIETYYIDPQRASLNLPESVLVSELISVRKQIINSNHEFFRLLRRTDVSSANLQSLMYYGSIRFPEIAEQMADLKRQEFQLWKRAVRNSIEKGEIPQHLDANQIAYIFASIKEASDFSLLVGQNYEDRFTSAIDYLFQLVGTKQSK